MILQAHFNTANRRPNDTTNPNPFITSAKHESPFYTSSDSPSFCNKRIRPSTKMAHILSFDVFQMPRRHKNDQNRRWEDSTSPLHHICSFFSFAVTAALKGFLLLREQLKRRFRVKGPFNIPKCCLTSMMHLHAWKPVSSLILLY